MRKITFTRTLKLAEDTTETECVSCEYRDGFANRDGKWSDRCNVFDVPLNAVSRRNFVKRAAECIAAEKAAKAPAQDEGFCACGRRTSECDRSRRACISQEAP